MTLVDQVLEEIEKQQAALRKRRGVEGMFIMLGSFEYGLIKAYCKGKTEPICGGAHFFRCDGAKIEVRTTMPQGTVL